MSRDSSVDQVAPPIVPHASVPNAPPRPQLRVPQSPPPRPTPRANSNVAAPPQTPSSPPAPIAPGSAPPEETAAPAPAFDIRRWLIFVPSWLVSLLVHVVVLLILALVTYSVMSDAVPEVVLASAIAPETQDEVLEFLDTPQVKLDSPVVAGGSELEAGVAPEGETFSSIDALSDTGEEMAAPPSDLPLGQVNGLKWRGMAEAGLGEGKGAEFFGVKASGRKFFFIVDASNSMKNGKWDAAKRELMAAVKRLQPTQSFYVILFNHSSHRMFNPKHPEPMAVKANDENIRRLEYWLDESQLELKTNPSDAVEFAVKALPDAIYLLTDGKFTDRGRTTEWLRKHNRLNDPVAGRGPKVVIHCIGFYSRDGEATLQDIAKDYGGTYRFVKDPRE